MAHGRPRITEDPPVRVTIDDDEEADFVDELPAGFRSTLQEDRRHLFDPFTEADVVRQVVGVGSVGMRVYLVLLEGRSGSDPPLPAVRADRGPRCTSPTSARAPTATTASGWWRASGWSRRPPTSSWAGARSAVTTTTSANSGT